MVLRRSPDASLAKVYTLVAASCSKAFHVFALHGGMGRCQSPCDDRHRPSRVRERRNGLGAIRREAFDLDYDDLKLPHEQFRSIFADR